MQIQWDIITRLIFLGNSKNEHFDYHMSVHYFLVIFSLLNKI